MAWSQGKVAMGFTRLSGERDSVSRLSIIVVTRAGLFAISHVIGSRKEESLVGVGSLLYVCVMIEGGCFQDGLI